MRVRKVLFLTVYLIVILGGVGPAGAEQVLSAKQQMINSIKGSDITLVDPAKGSSGTMYFKIKELSGSLLSPVSEVKAFKDADIKLEYKLNTTQKKLELGYLSNINEETYLGSLFIEGSKIIFTRDIFKMARLVDPKAGVDEYEDLNHFVYFKDKGFEQIWDSFLKSDKKDMLPAYRELCIFFVEAIPEKYFSSTGKTVLFSMDSQGVEDSIYWFFQKIKNEKEIFADLLANLMIGLEPSVDAEEVRKEIIKSIDDSLKEGFFPGNAQQVKELLPDFGLERLSYETELSPAGKSSFTLMISYADRTSSNFRLVLNTVISGSKDNYKGLYDFKLSGQDANNTVVGFWKGEYNQSGVDYKEKDQIEFNSRDAENNTLINLALQVDTSIRTDRNVPVSIPALTEYNSTDLDKSKKVKEEIIEEISIVFDGNPVTFDVPPYIKGGKRVMVPVRNLAQLLGCEVNWNDPNEVRINRDNISIVMYVDERLYTVNGLKKQLDLPPVQADGRILVPLRFMAQELGCRVKYEDSSKTVYIYSPGN